MKKTERGLTIFSEFKDKYGANVTIQESSSAEYERCWIFIEGGNVDNNNGSAHLSKQQAKWVIKALEKFIKS